MQYEMLSSDVNVISLLLKVITDVIGEYVIVCSVTLRLLNTYWQLKAERESLRLRELENQLRLQTERTDELQNMLASVRTLHCHMLFSWLTS